MLRFVLYCIIWRMLMLHEALAPGTVEENVESLKVELTQGTVNPLVFYRIEVLDKEAFSDLEIITNENSFPVYKPSEIILLCPIEEEDNKTLFIRGIFPNIEAVRDAGELKCRYNVKLSADKKKLNIYGIGYSIHRVNYTFRKFFEGTPFFERLLHMSDEDKREHYSFPIYSVKFNRDLIKPNFVTHTVYANLHADDYWVRCIWRDLFDEVYIGEFYEKENQNEIIYEMTRSAQSRTYGYLVRHLLAPFQDNASKAVRLGLCSYFNVIPLWQRVSKGSVRKVEEYIRKVADIIGYVDVKTGVFDTLMLPKEVFLDSELKRIPVPRILWKTLTFKVELPDTLEIVKYSMDIFVHNEPTNLIEKKICEESVCERFGWNFRIDDNEIGLTYCCLFYNLDFPSYMKNFNPYSTEDFRPFDLKNMLVKSNDGTVETVNVFDRLKKAANFAN